MRASCSLLLMLRRNCGIVVGSDDTDRAAVVVRAATAEREPEDAADHRDEDHDDDPDALAHSAVPRRGWTAQSTMLNTQKMAARNPPTINSLATPPV